MDKCGIIRNISVQHDSSNPLDLPYPMDNSITWFTWFMRFQGSPRTDEAGSGSSFYLL